ncbi:Rieske 2Fe-2S domain-containing protein [Porticoccaceae bacterium]|nr:Rieske 2Fe-2S domain-containing protein [Porticoccaceae bacterium]
MIIATDRKSHSVNLPIPTGWFQVLYSHEIEVGQAKPLEYFDQEMVVFRTESGQAKVVDAYCPHMGAHLGYGIRDQAGHGSAVVGESIVCPFHGWAYDGDGKCTSIPYAKNMPPKVARGEQVLGTWHVREINQCILVWYHPHGEAPTYEPLEIVEANANNADWGALDCYSWEINTHMQEVGENAVDSVHFLYVHGTKDIPDAEVMEFEGHTRRGLLRTRNPTPKGVIEGSIENQNIGPGLAVVRFSGIVDTVLLAHLTPVSANHTRAFYSFILKNSDAESGKSRIAEAIVRNICQQMEEDRIIWNRKKYYEKPMLCDGDGPFAKFRKWYKQFLIE